MVVGVHGACARLLSFLQTVVDAQDRDECQAPSGGIFPSFLQGLPFVSFFTVCERPGVCGRWWPLFLICKLYSVLLSLFSWQGLALFVYLFGGVLFSSYVFIFVVCILLLAFDFWTVKVIGAYMKASVCVFRR